MGVTIQQIAKRIGVAPSTVSAVLSPVCKKRVSQEKKKEIQIVAKEMGYRPNLSARRLRTGQTFNVGVVIPSFLSHHPISTYFDLVSLACGKRGFHAIPLVIERNFANMPKQLDMLEDHHVDGLIFFDYMRQAYDQYLRFWQDNNAMVFRILDPSLVNLPFKGVLVDHYTAGKKLIEHVIAEGWTDLYFVTETVGDQLWEKGYGRAWAEFSVQAYNKKHSNIIVYEKRQAIDRYRTIREFVQSNPVHKGRAAFVLDGGDGSSGVYCALQEAGLVIGRDVAVAAMNHLPMNEFVNPSLTMLSEPYEEIANLMVDELLCETEGKGAQRISGWAYEPELITGASTVKNDCK